MSFTNLLDPTQKISDSRAMAQFTDWVSLCPRMTHPPTKSYTVADNIREQKPVYQIHPMSNVTW